MADNVVETILVKLGLDGSSYNRDADKAIKTNEKLNKSVEKTDKVVGAVATTMGRWFSVIAMATGVGKLISEVQRLNDELFHLEKNLGMSAETIKSWQGAAGAMGGSASGMTSSMKSLNMAMNDFVIMGDSSMLPYMNALGVSMVDAQGKLRDTDKVMLDLADSFSKMDREQAFSLASKMGIDEGTFNTLVQGRKEMEKMIEYQKTMYKSSEAELQASRELSKNRALLGQHWESLKTMLANVLIPVFVKLSEVMLGMFEYLQKHQRAVQAVFKGLAFIIGAVLTPILFKAAVAALAFIAPFAPFILVVTALGTAFIALYDDYKTWAEGGKSLFDWGKFSLDIDTSKISVDSLKKGFAYLLTGYTDWASAAENGREWLKLKGFIQDNETSVASLTQGFKNLAREVLDEVIPTLKGYASIITKIFNGDFNGALLEAKSMGEEFWRRTKATGSAVLNHVGNAANIATGQQLFDTSTGSAPQYIPLPPMQSTAQNDAGFTPKGTPTKGFTADKAKTIARVAKNIGVSPNDLAAVISFETGGTFSPSAKNPTSSATGLIQFMKGSGGTKGQYYGMSRDKFGSLSFDEQMKYVERYFKERDGRFKAGNEGKNTVADVYTAVTGYGYRDVPQYNKKGKRIDPYFLNRVWDSNGDGYIAKGEMVQNDSFKKHQREYFPQSNATEQQESMRQGSNAMPANMQSRSANIRNDVNIGDINVYTTASTISGTTTDAMGAVNNQIGMIVPAFT